MSRFSKLFCKLKTKFPDDWYIKGVEESIKIDPLALSVFKTYELAISSLDDASWDILESKAISEFVSNIDNRGKQPFYDQLNEAFAYSYLLKRGYSQISFVKENSNKRPPQKTPDISFIRNNSPAFCEVKTLNISDNEICRMRSRRVFDTHIYQQLDQQFLEKKLLGTLNKASQQIMSHGSDGLIFVIMHPDDFSLANLSTYKQQILDILNSKFFSREIYIQFGLQGRDNIHHYPV